jgi:hypothetical protein
MTGITCTVRTATPPKGDMMREPLTGGVFTTFSTRLELQLQLLSECLRHGMLIKSEESLKKNRYLKCSFKRYIFDGLLTDNQPTVDFEIRQY